MTGNMKVPSIKNHYETLGVDPKAEPDVVKREYLKKARLLHPDNNSGLTELELEKREREMKDINVAWNIISNPDKRKEYDESFNKGIMEDALRQTNRKITQEFLIAQEPREDRKTKVASLKEMEIRGFAKLMKPLPLFLLLFLVVAVVIAGFVIGGDGNTTKSNAVYVPEVSDETPKLCIDIAPVEEVPCDGREDASVWEIVGVNEKCSSGLSYEYRSQIGGGYCVAYSTKSMP